jgi:hypothetical protein
MISGRVRSDTLARLGLGERENRVRGAASLERSPVLKILALELQSRSGQGVERLARHYRGSMDATLDAGAGLLNEVPGETGCIAAHCRK